MVECHRAKYCSLHVRETNYAAFHLYKDTLKFDVRGVEEKYYADGENAFEMRKNLDRAMVGLPPLPLTKEEEAAEAAAAAAAEGGAPSAALAAARRRKAAASGAAAVAGTGGVTESAPSSGGASATAAAASLDEAAIAAAIEAIGADADIEPGARDLKGSAVAGGGGAKKGKGKKR